jgi:hypothetical protein
MQQTKMEIFKIDISNDSKLTLDKKGLTKINLFLSEDNYIYINHSTSIISSSYEEYGSIKSVDRFLIVSLIYKDLNESEYDIKNASTKVKAAVTKEIESGSSIKSPGIETSFDKEIQRLEKELSMKKALAIKKIVSSLDSLDKKTK